MNTADFEKLVIESLAGLPEEIKKAMDNVAVVIGETPADGQLKDAGVRIGDTLLGLYQGVPKTTWGRGFGGNLPDKITIFKRSIERFAKNPEEIKELVCSTVYHEIAHHFGFSEKGARKIELKIRKKG